MKIRKRKLSFSWQKSILKSQQLQKQPSPTEERLQEVVHWDKDLIKHDPQSFIIHTASAAGLINAMDFHDTVPLSAPVNSHRQLVGKLWMWAVFWVWHALTSSVPPFLFWSSLSGNRSAESWLRPGRRQWWQHHQPLPNPVAAAGGPAESGERKWCFSPCRDAECWRGEGDPGSLPGALPAELGVWGDAAEPQQQHYGAEREFRLRRCVWQVHQVRLELWIPTASHH